jgi:hypothetical protein
VFAFYVTFTFVGCSKLETKTASQPGAEQAVNDVVDVYIYGYPLVTMDMTRKFITDYATVQGGRGPIRANHQASYAPGPREIELIRIGNHRR